jgi:hypothetical protein
MEAKHATLWKDLEPVIAGNKWKELSTIAERVYRDKEESMSKIAQGAPRKPRGEPSKIRRSISAVMASITGSGGLNRLSDTWHGAMLSTFARCECVLRGKKACSRCSVIAPSGAATYVEQIAATIFDKIKIELAGVKSLALTADGWSDRQTRKYLAVTGHWFNKDWDLVSVVLGVVLVRDGDAETIQHHLSEVISRYESGTVFFCSLIVTDQEKAMRRAASMFMDGEENTEICFAHDVQLCVNDVVRFTGSRVYLSHHRFVS